MFNVKTPNQLLTYAVQELNFLNSEEVFLVKDLFKGYEWNRIAKNDRMKLGILFLNEVQSNPSLNVEVLDKTSSNQQRYKKK